MRKRSSQGNPSWLLMFLIIAAIVWLTPIRTTSPNVNTAHVNAATLTPTHVKVVQPAPTHFWTWSPAQGQCPLYGNTEGYRLAFTRTDISYQDFVPNVVLLYDPTVAPWEQEYMAGRLAIGLQLRDGKSDWGYDWIEGLGLGNPMPAHAIAFSTPVHTVVYAWAMYQGTRNGCFNAVLHLSTTRYTGAVALRSLVYQRYGKDTILNATAVG